MDMTVARSSATAAVAMDVTPIAAASATMALEAFIRLLLRKKNRAY